MWLQGVEDSEAIFVTNTLGFNDEVIERKILNKISKKKTIIQFKN